MTEPGEAALPVPDGFGVSGAALTVAGHTLEALAAKAGQTPFFVYSREAIVSRVAALRGALPADIRLRYAIKANPFQPVVDLLTPLVDGFDVASSGELEIALAGHMPPSDISFAGPGKTDMELHAAVQAGITVNLESAGEMRRLAAIGEASGSLPRVAIRVNPAFELRQSGMRMGGGAKPFGIDEELVPETLRELSRLPLEFEGFHIFAGSQILSEAMLIECQQKTVELARRLSAAAPTPPRLLNIGGGFGIPYFPGEKPLDLERVGAALEETLAPLRRDLPGVRFAIELGRYLVGEAGLYVSRVVDRKTSRGKTFLITDGGLHHHLALSGNFGQVVRRNYPVAIADKFGSEAVEQVDVVGCLCTPLDRLADGVRLPRGEVGDLLVVFQSGAYAASASPAGFLSHPPAAQLLA